MYCKFCGKQVEDHSVFCKHCGNRLAEGSSAAPGPKPGLAKKQKVFLLLGCAAVVLLAVVLAMAFSGGDGGRKSPVKKDQAFVGGYAASDTQTKSAPESAVTSAVSGIVLPDPEACSGGKIEYLKSHEYEGYKMNSYRVSITEFEKLSEYTQLLQVNGFVLRDFEQGDSENEICWVFDYAGEGELDLFTIEKTKGGMPRENMAVYLASVPIKGQDTVAVVLAYADGLNLEDTGEYFGEKTSAPAATAAALPDPARYFADWAPEAAKLSKDGADYTVSVEFPTTSKYSDSEMETVLDAYLGLLEEYGFEKIGEEEEGSSVFHFFNGGEGTYTVSRYGYDEEPASVVLTYHRAGRILMVHYSAALKVDESSPKASLGFMKEEEKDTPKPKATEKPKATAKTTAAKSKATKKPAATAKPTEKPKASGGKTEASSVKIPDFGTFSGIDLAPTQEKTKGKSTEKHYFFQTNEKIVEEYIELLTEKYNFKVRKDSDNVIRTVTLDYTGTGSVGTFDVRKQKAVSVYLWAYHMPDTEFHVTYGDGLDYTDTGDRTSQTIKKRTEDENGSADGGGGSDDDSAWKGSVKEIQCTKCFGKKTVACTNCDGKGYKEKVVESPNFGGGVKRKTVKESCYKCNNGQIECPRCHGTGKQ